MEKTPSEGELTTDQIEPSQCSINARSGPLAPRRCPTAQTLVDEMACTAYSWLPLVPGLGLGTTDHAVPSKCSIRVLNLPLLPVWVPTAQTSEGETAVTADNMSAAPAWGWSTTLHCVPSQASIRLCCFDVSSIT